MFSKNMIVLTRSEKKGLLFLAGIVLAGFFVEGILPYQEQTNIYDYHLADSLFDVLSSDTAMISTEGNTKVAGGTVNEQKAKLKRGLPVNKIDINHATVEQLVMLPGIGPKTAKRIVDFRNKNGLFRYYDDLLKIERIGPKTLKKLKPLIYLEKAEP